MPYTFSGWWLEVRHTGRRLTQIGILLTLLVTPLWRRMPYAPTTYDPFYSLGFLISLPIMLTLVAWVISGLAGLRGLLRQRLRLIAVLALLALAGWMWLSVRWSFMAGHNQPNVAQSTALQWTLLALWVAAAASAGPPPRQAAFVLVISAGLHAGVAIMQAMQQSSLGLALLGEFAASPDWAGANVLVSGDVRWLRPAGFMPHPNTLAGVLLPGLLATVVCFSAERPRTRVLGLAALGVILSGFLLTFSRSAYLGLAAGGFALLPLLWPLLRDRIRRRWIVLAAAVTLLIGGAFGWGFRDLLLTRTGVGTENTEMRSIADRLVFSAFAYRAITEARQNTIFGIGAGNFPWRSSYYLVETDYDLRGNNVHHVFLSALVETGLIGYGMFVLALVALFEASLRSRRRGSHLSDAQTPDFTAQSCFLVTTVAFAVVGLFDHYPWTILHFQVMWWGLLMLSSAPLQLSSESS